jgi:hypothetical protein
MRSELETHLKDAVNDGKSLESVIGENTASFAEEWAREFRAPVEPFDRRAAFGPALLGFVTAIIVGVASFAIATSERSVGCCPRRVVETSTSKTGLIFFGITLAVAILALAGSVLLMTGRTRTSEFLWGLGIPVAVFSAGTWFASILLFIALIWARQTSRVATHA